MYLGATGCNWRSLDVWWACLGSSRTFGLRQVLAGQSYRCQVGKAHSGSRIEVVGVREQLGGQGRLCIEVCVIYGVGDALQNPTDEGYDLHPWVE